MRGGSNVIATRTFSKLHAMAGVPAGLRMRTSRSGAENATVRNNVIGIFGCASRHGRRTTRRFIVEERLTRRNRIRAEVVPWLDERGFRFIPPRGNFVLIDIGRDVKDAIPRMLAEGVVVGRRFAAVSGWMRVTMGTRQEMEKFKVAFKKVAR